MSAKKPDYQKVSSEPQAHAPFDYIVIIESTEAELFIHQTLVNSLSLGNRVEKRSCTADMIQELRAIERLSDVPDLIIFTLDTTDPESLLFLDAFNELPDLVRAKCKLIVLTPAQSREAKLKTIMNPSVIRYLEKPVDLCHFRDFMFM